jgi:hypothetical protein
MIYASTEAIGYWVQYSILSVGLSGLRTIGTWGSLKSDLAELALRFRSDLAIPIEQNPAKSGTESGTIS